jgi:hypothetical protein
MGAGSVECHLAEVERDENRLGHLLHVLIVGVDAACAWHLDPLEIAIAADIVGAAVPAQDIDGVVVATHEAVGAKMSDLRFGVAGDAVGKGDLQPAPFLAILMPWLDLFTLEARVGVEEGRSEVGPQGLAGEVGDVEFVPWRFERLAGKRGLGIVATLNEPSSVSSTSRSGTNTLRRSGAVKGVIVSRSACVSISKVFSASRPGCCLMRQIAPSTESSVLSVLNSSQRASPPWASTASANRSFMVFSLIDMAGRALGLRKASFGPGTDHFGERFRPSAKTRMDAKHGPVRTRPAA